MSTRLRSIVAAAALASLALSLYLVRLDRAVLAADEVTILQQARAITAGTAGGWPLYFHAGGEQWLPPVAVYATALVTLATPADQAGRIAAAFAGALSVGVMFVLARLLVPSPLAAVGIALLLALTPAHYTYARTGVDVIFVVPFVVAWLIGVTRFAQEGNPRWMALASLALGFGTYTQRSAPLTMTFLMVVTLVVMRRSAPSLRAVALVLAGFVVPLAGSFVWLVGHPERYADTFGRWVTPAAHLRFPLDGLSAFVNWNTLSTRASIYWGFFDPAWLFFDGPVAAPFFLASAVLAGLWLVGILNAPIAPLDATLAAALAVAPLAAASFGQLHPLADAFAVVPLLVVIAAVGAIENLRRTSRVRLGVAWFAIAVAVIEAARFYLPRLSA